LNVASAKIIAERADTTNAGVIPMEKYFVPQWAGTVDSGGSGDYAWRVHHVFT
jgi:hypothetical protein